MLPAMTTLGPRCRSLAAQVAGGGVAGASRVV